MLTTWEKAHGTNTWISKHPEMSRIYKREQYQRETERCPWVHTYRRMIDRCRGYAECHRRAYKNRGIEVRITLDEVKEIWDRDNASAMESPTVHRIDNDGHYTKDNIEFIEQREHRAMHGKTLWKGRWASA